MCKTVLATSSSLWLLAGSTLGSCVPTATPDPVASKAARAEIAVCDSFLTEPLCETVAVKYQLASDYAILGDFDRTIALAAEVAQADQGFDFPLDREFKPLANCLEFTRIADSIHGSHLPVHRCLASFTIDDRRLIPEGLAYDERTQSFLLGSLNEKRIIRYSKEGIVSEFAQAGRNGLSAVLGIRMDPRDGSVWVASGEDAEHAALFHFSPTGEFIRKFRPPKDKSDHLFNDLVVRRDGAVFLTDSTANQVYTLPKDETELVPVRTSRRLYYPNGIALSPDDKTVFIADAFGILACERISTPVRRHADTPIPADIHPVRPGAHMTLSGFDGLYTWRDCLVGVQNSLGSPRVVVARLNSDRTEATALIVLEYRTKYSQLPTTGALVGDTFYFITNSQIDHYKNGKLLNPEGLVPIVVAKVDLVEPSG
jgi:SMP-30/Gluconolactonase/LRE-like region